MAFTRPDGAVGFSITAQGDPSIPAFVNPTHTSPSGGEPLTGGGDDAQEHRVYFGGLNYVGNRRILILPMSGASGGQLFAIFGFATMLLALGGGTLYAKRTKLGPWKDDDEFIAHMQALGHNCAGCKRGIKVSSEKAACMRYGVVPLDRVCVKFEQKDGKKLEQSG